jgi:hypothetical protein
VLVHGVLPAAPHWRSPAPGSAQAGRATAELVHGPLTLSVKRKTAFGWSLTLLELLGRFMEDARAMSRAMPWGDAAYIEDMVERGRKIRRCLIELKQAQGTGRVEI